jgi:hypothetical protein
MPVHRHYLVIEFLVDHDCLPLALMSTVLRIIQLGTHFATDSISHCLLDALTHWVPSCVDVPTPRELCAPVVTQRCSCNGFFGLGAHGLL